MRTRLESIDRASLVDVNGGSFTSAAKATWTGTKYVLNASDNFLGGLVGGAIHGVGATNAQMRFWGKGTTSGPGFKLGAELGMMVNYGAGPVGGLLATVSGSLPSGTGGR